MRARKVVSMSITQDEYRLWKACASGRGIGLSSAIRELALRGAEYAAVGETTRSISLNLNELVDWMAESVIILRAQMLNAFPEQKPNIDKAKAETLSRMRKRLQVI